MAGPFAKFLNIVSIQYFLEVTERFVSFGGAVAPARCTRNSDAVLLIWRISPVALVGSWKIRNWASTWFYWALLSAVFAALTAIFAKIGIQGVDSDYSFHF